MIFFLCDQILSCKMWRSTSNSTWWEKSAKILWQQYSTAAQQCIWKYFHKYFECYPFFLKEWISKGLLLLLEWHDSCSNSRSSMASYFSLLYCRSRWSHKRELNLWRRKSSAASVDVIRFASRTLSSVLPTLVTVFSVEITTWENQGFTLSWNFVKIVDVVLRSKIHWFDVIFSKKVNFRILQFEITEI